MSNKFSANQVKVPSQREISDQKDILINQLLARKISIETFAQRVQEFHTKYESIGSPKFSRNDFEGMILKRLQNDLLRAKAEFKENAGYNVAAFIKEYKSKVNQYLESTQYAQHAKLTTADYEALGMQKSVVNEMTAFSNPELDTYETLDMNSVEVEAFQTSEDDIDTESPRPSDDASESETTPRATAAGTTASRSATDQALPRWVRASDAAAMKLARPVPQKAATQTASAPAAKSHPSEATLHTLNFLVGVNKIDSKYRNKEITEKINSAYSALASKHISPSKALELIITNVGKIDKKVDRSVLVLSMKESMFLHAMLKIPEFKEVLKTDPECRNVLLDTANKMKKTTSLKGIILEAVSTAVKAAPRPSENAAPTQPSSAAKK